MKTLVWESLGRVSPRELVPGRALLHHAAQLAAAVGRCLLAPRPDDGHTSLEWRGEARALAGEEVPGPRPWRAGLRPEDLSLAVLAPGGEGSLLPLPGRTQSEAFAWLVDRAAHLGAAADQLRLDLPYTIPEHPVGRGAPFPSADDGSLAELARWFADGNAAVQAVAQAWPGASPVRVWPHHFDVGSVLPFGSGSGEDAASIGIGLSPGDQEIAEPYLYATPWPPPPPGSRPDMPAGGRWHEEGWTGAVLTGTEVVDAGSGAAQAATANAFLAETVEALRAWHERRGA